MLTAAQRYPVLAFPLSLLRSYSASALAFCLSLFVFFVLKYHIIGTGSDSTLNGSVGVESIHIRMAVVLVLALLCSSIRMADLDIPVRRFLRVLTPLLAFYVFLAGPRMIMPDVDHADRLRLLIALAWVAPVLGVLAWWRPLLALPLVALLLWQKELMPTLNEGFTLTTTDYMPLFDALLLMLVGVVVVRLLAYSRSWQKAEQMRVASGLEVTPLMTIFLALIGIHFSNYFHSGWAKIVLDGGPLSWLLENRTDYLAHGTWEVGLLPLAVAPSLAAAVLALMRPPVVQIMNAMTLFPQLACPLAAFNRRVLIFFLLFFDLQHIVIYFVTGIAFWKWVALNTAFVAALVRWPARRPPVALSLLMVFLAIVPLMMPFRIPFPGARDFSSRGQLFFFTARLGWYDSPAVNHIYLTAILDDGRELQVPSNYFRAMSVLFAQQRMGQMVGNMWPTGTWGATGKYEIMKGGLTCSLPLTQPPASTEKLDRFIQLVRERHAKNLQVADQNGHLAYDLYPHHIWSNPALYTEFAALDFRKIRSFRLTFEAVCANWYGGERHSKVVATQSVDIPL